MQIGAVRVAEGWQARAGCIPPGANGPPAAPATGCPAPAPAEASACEAPAAAETSPC